MNKTILTCAFLICSATNTLAGVVTIQPLDFGRFVIINNDAVRSLTVNTNGTSTFDTAGFVDIDASTQEGIYDIDEIPPLTAIGSVIVTQKAPLSGATGPNFAMSSFQETHTPVSDVNGEIRVTLGGTITTSGSGVSYPDQSYAGSIQIQINY